MCLRHCPERSDLRIKWNSSKNLKVNSEKERISKMKKYNDSQTKEDLATLGIKEEAELTSDLVTAMYKKLAIIHHPDKGGEKDA